MSKTSLEILFDYVKNQRETSIPKQLLKWACDQYDFIYQRLPPKEHTIINYLSTFLQNAKENKLDIAYKQLNLAEGEYVQIQNILQISQGPGNHGRSQGINPSGAREIGQDGEYNGKHPSRDDRTVPGPTQLQSTRYDQLSTAGNVSDPPQHNDSTPSKQAQPVNHSHTTEQANTYPNAYSKSKDEQKSFQTSESSKRASQKMKHNNPNIADLSDTNRPTKIAERFSELYDNQWTEAYEALMKGNEKEEQTINFLLQIVQGAFNFCKAESEKQVSDMTLAFQKLLEFGDPTADGKKIKSTLANADTNLLIQYRKELAELALPRLQRDFIDRPELFPYIFSQSFGSNKKKPGEKGPTAMYAKRCVELTWWMCVQDPPILMHRCDPKDDSFNSNIYRAYTRTGTKVKFYVWPALILNEGGPVLMKGVAQCR